jgi:hypothetical protein
VHVPWATWGVFNPVADGGAWITTFSETDALVLLRKWPDNSPGSRVTDDGRTRLKLQR